MTKLLHKECVMVPSTLTTHAYQSLTTQISVTRKHYSFATVRWDGMQMWTDHGCGGSFSSEYILLHCTVCNWICAKQVCDVITTRIWNKNDCFVLMHFVLMHFVLMHFVLMHFVLMHFVLINSVILNLLCVWILLQGLYRKNHSKFTNFSQTFAIWGKKATQRYATLPHIW